MFDEPIFKDEYFRRKPKKNTSEWTIVDAPSTFVPIADTHAHLDMLSDPALALARAGVHNVGFVEAMVDPLSDLRDLTYKCLDEWIFQANILIRNMSTRICGQGWNSVPRVRISVGVHPHEASKFDDAALQRIVELAKDERTSAIGEIGLDYHYDFSPRDIQKSVFREQIRLAQSLELPVVLHVREAFDDAFEIMSREGFSDAGVILHCYTSDAREVRRWVDAGCYVAFGGALTFKSSDEIRQAAKVVPLDKLLVETDSPYMAPVPFRGQNCEPSHVVWNSMALFSLLHSDAQYDNSYDAVTKINLVYSSEEEQAMRSFFTQTYNNALRILDRQPTAYQKEAQGKPQLGDCLQSQSGFNCGLN